MAADTCRPGYGPHAPRGYSAYIGNISGAKLSRLPQRIARSRSSSRRARTGNYQNSTPDLPTMAAFQQLTGRSPRPSTSHQARPFTTRQRPTARRHRHQLTARAEDGETQNVSGTGGQGKLGISEDVLERLRKAEAEAASLRAQLKASRPVVDQAVVEEEAAPTGKRASRIDGSSLKRETLFTSREERGSWLNEADFMTGGGPSELADKQGANEQEQGEVQRRVIIGALASVGLGALALIPMDALGGKPSKPLFYYLTPLVRIQGLLTFTDEIVSEARWADLPPALSRIQGAPNNLKQNVDDAAACLPGKQRDQAMVIGKDLQDFIAQIDYQKYYDTMGQPGMRGGAQEAAFAKYSRQAVAASQGKLAELLALMPRDELAAAQRQAGVTPF